MNQKLICVGTLAQWNVRVVEKAGMSDGAAAYTLAPADQGTDVLALCLQNRKWHDVLTALIHEATEAQIHKWGLGYASSLIPRYDAGGFTFIVSHKQFSEILDWVGLFVCQVHNQVQNAWKKANCRAKKKK